MCTWWKDLLSDMKKFILYKTEVPKLLELELPLKYLLTFKPTSNRIHSNKHILQTVELMNNIFV
jgi:hypothetical protein